MQRLKLYTVWSVPLEIYFSFYAHINHLINTAGKFAVELRVTESLIDI